MQRSSVRIPRRSPSRRIFSHTPHRTALVSARGYCSACPDGALSILRTGSINEFPNLRLALLRNGEVVHASFFLTLHLEQSRRAEKRAGAVAEPSVSWPAALREERSVQR
jgi:hypothetical protein